MLAFCKIADNIFHLNVHNYVLYYACSVLWTAGETLYISIIIINCDLPVQKTALAYQPSEDNDQQTSE